MNITNGIEISAEAHRDAYAALALAEGYSEGMGEDGARAVIAAYGEDGGHATTSVESITITATSHNGDAYAGTNFALSASSTGYIAAYSDGEDIANSSAHLDILGGITVTADAQNDAIAMIDNISTTAYWSGESVVDIGNISLTATGEGYTSAYISDIGARASFYAAAETNVGNITINVGGNEADNAYAYINVQAEAQDDSNATVTIGDITMNAEADFTGGDAQVSLDINTDTSDLEVDQSSFALVDIGNIDLSVTGGEGDNTYVYASFYADVSDDGASSRIQAGDITLTSHVSTMDAGEDTIHLNIRAEEVDFASVSVGDISVNLLGEVSSSAYVNVGGANIDIDQIDIGNLYVNAEDANSIADIYINGIEATYDRSATFTGAGDVYLNLDTYRNGDSTDMAFDKIYLTDVNYSYATSGGNVSVNVDADHDGSLHFNWGNESDSDVLLSTTGNLTLESAGGQQDLIAHTTIYGYDTDGNSSIRFNDIFASDTNFIDLSDPSPLTSANDLWSSIIEAMDGANEAGQDSSDVFIYNTVNEVLAGDINGDGYKSTNLGVLAYDKLAEDDGNLTALVFLNDINGTITAESISSGYIIGG